MYFNNKKKKKKKTGRSRGTRRFHCRCRVASLTICSIRF